MICALGQRSRSDAAKALMDSAPYVRVIGGCGESIYDYECCLLGVSCHIGYLIKYGISFVFAFLLMMRIFKFKFSGSAITGRMECKERILKR